MAINVSNTITQAQYINKMRPQTEEERASQLLTEFYTRVHNSLTADDLWGNGNVVVVCSSESSTVKRLVMCHLQDNGWCAHVALRETVVVVLRPKCL